MRNVDLKTARSTPGQENITARLVRHLDARLRDFGPGGPEVLEADQNAGVVTARFPGHDTARVLGRLEGEYGVSAGQENGLAVFRLSPDVPFEDLDYVWGCLFDLLS
ncbi:hypothetical protein [Pseudoflavonifractor phocaeensis]|uniref:hypothetical protein n=1 Tax=Pseudoflavonifractor phocaeensis TaxID=1870988 RepID=UPI001F3E2B1E|nr:hypothetical protein [Pseudoflavonifractor phocaeensis]MCF2662808.1 hypothetical protein [Pseudoflavonifractor phocaeensis]